MEAVSPGPHSASLGNLGWQSGLLLPHGPHGECRDLLSLVMVEVLILTLPPGALEGRLYFWVGVEV